MPLTSRRRRPLSPTMLWFVLARFFVASLFLGAAVVFGSVGGAAQGLLANIPLLTLLSLTLLQICSALFWLLRFGFSPRFVQVQLVWDLLLCAAIVYVTGGLQSQFAFLFIFVLLGSAFVSRPAEVMATLLASLLLYGGLVLLQYGGYLPLPGEMPVPREMLGTLLVNLCAFALAGALSVLLAVRLRQQARQLHRQQIEHADLERFNEQILRHMTSGLIVVDCQGRIRSCNSAAAAIRGLAPEQLLGHPLNEVFVLPWPFSHLPLERAELEFVHPDGHPRIIGYGVTAFEQEQQNHVLLTFQDLTRVKELERHLQRRERLAAVGALAAGLAHEIRNPLASLSGSAQLLQEQSPDAGQQRLLAILVRESERLNRLLNDFLSFARPRPPELRLLDLAGLLRELCEQLACVPGFTGLGIELDLPDQWQMMLDEQQLRQAVWNLLLNAAQFSPPGGRIFCVARPLQRCFWIEDEGPGITEAERERIFEPFYTTRNQGTGLGLSIAHGLLAAQQARLDLVIVQGRGARFRVTFGEVDRLNGVGGVYAG